MSRPLSLSFYCLSANLEWWWRGLLFRVHLQHQSEAQQVGAKFAPDFQAVLSERENDWKLDTLRRILRRVPFWGRGHLMLARLALARRDVSTAYASAQAALVLLRRPEDRAYTQLVLGRCYLQRGQLETALQALNLVPFEGVWETEAREEMAAVLLALQRPQEAAAVLEGIPAGRRSQSAEAALRYATKHKSS
ncbi:MAG: hypothetical protein K1X79_02965 [Oligoflexia bacterium]|nr:hypothetical protein [Oligoflexia bacterium]